MLQAVSVASWVLHLMLFSVPAQARDKAKNLKNLRRDRVHL
jgi:hypothetical protein